MLCSGFEFSGSLCYLQVTSVFTQASVLLLLSSVNLLLCCLAKKRNKHNNNTSSLPVGKSPSARNPSLSNKIKGHSVRWLLMIVTTILLIVKLAESVFSAVMFYLSTGRLVYLFALDDCLTLLVLLSIALTYTHVVEGHKRYSLLWVLWIYWAAVIALKLCSVVVLCLEEDATQSANVLFSLLLVVVYLSLFLLDTYLNFSKCLQTSSKLHVTAEDDNEDIVYRYPYVSLPSQVTWHWMNGLLLKGYRKPLDIADLGVLPKDETAKNNFERFKHLFEKEKVSARSKGKEPSLWKCYVRSSWPLLIISGVCKLIYDIAIFVPPMCLDKIVDYVIETRGDLMQPQADGDGFNMTSTASPENITLEPAHYFVPTPLFLTNGFVLALLMLLAAMVQGSCMQLYLYLSAKNGIRLKGALQAMVYHKTLRLPSKCLTDGQMSQGQVLNHMSVDSINVFMLFNLGHLTWGIPVQVIIGCVLLYHQLGYTTLISTTIILVSCPLQYLLGNKLASLQKNALDLADERIQKCNETLQSMKLLKLYAWEMLFEKSVLETRRREVMYYLKAAMCRTLSILITDGVPILVCVVTFTLYPYLEKKPLTPGKVFSSYAILNIIGLCLFLTPFVINVWSHAVVSTRRLHRFFTAEELKPTSRGLEQQLKNGPSTNEDKIVNSASPVVFKNKSLITDINHKAKDPLLHNNPNTGATVTHNNQSEQDVTSQKSGTLSHNNAQRSGSTTDPANQSLDEDTVLQISNGSFAWDSTEDSDPVLKDINLNIQRGKLTMVVGAVGTGKSSLLSALLGEMVQQTGDLTWNSGVSVAYGSQKAWLLNASLRDNILFGKPFQSQWYSQVVKACALQPDIDMLIAGDQTEIGEKGINVSGGQKQRISVGRAMYSATNCILLDDPFSALDAHVGSHIFKEGIQKLLLEQQKTIVLVTHQLQYLPYADEIIAMKGGQIVAKGTYDTLLKTNPEIFQIIEQENLEEKHAKETASVPSQTPKLRLHIPNATAVEERDYAMSSTPKLSPRVGSNVYVHQDASSSPMLRERSNTRGYSPSAAQMGHAKTSPKEQTKSQNDLRPHDTPEEEHVTLLRFRGAGSKSQEHLSEDKDGKKIKESEKPKSPDRVEMDSFLATSRLASSLTSLSYSPAVDSSDMRKVIFKEQISKEGEVGLVQKGQLIGEEERETGSVSLSVCWKYTKAASLILVAVTLSAYVLRQATRMGTDLWLAKWSEAGIQAEVLLQHPNYTNLTLNDTYDLQYYIRGYLMWQGISFLFLLLAIVCLECMTLNAACNLHKRMLRAVVMAPMRFFDTTPIGRIINRLSGDTNKLDEQMPVTIDNVLYCILYVMGGLVLNAIFIPAFILPVLVMLVFYVLIQRFYMASCREMQRLDSVTKSPILAHFSQTLGGLDTIRAYAHQPRFQEQNLKHVDTNNTAFLFLHTTNGWMGIRLECIGAIITFFSAVLTISWGILGYIDPSIVGIAIAYATTSSSFLNWFMKNFSELEMWLNAAERVTHYTGVEPEKNAVNATTPSDWPQHGEICFRGVSLRYDASLDPVIHKLDLHIKAGVKVGICGRTGSGKSSLTLSIFNMIDICEGQVLIDGIDIKEVSLHDLRSRLAIIPQDPILFSGTVRYNVDPELQYSEECVWRALEIAQLKPLIQSLTGQLEAKVDESGDNFSVGQRQLFCLARAFLRNAKILVMDEPTASVDMATDAVIQEVTQTAFKDKTIVTIAHRVTTILNYDTIVVLSAGKIIEKGSPSELIKNEFGSFATMLKQNQ